MLLSFKSSPLLLLCSSTGDGSQDEGGLGVAFWDGLTDSTCDCMRYGMRYGTGDGVQDCTADNALDMATDKACDRDADVEVDGDVDGWGDITKL